ncbi:BF2992 family fimbrillin-A clan protein [Bacteroides caecigallinarum]|uniref:BF2992 family fimbrillin-A clan protein n=1 Tax=Bacteroides caecigallinarum TaxID=1411144 RepID=UPI0019564B38|nr:BF2992 family fimbrillin-A clan protein [Bacteroides caecigallinarum]MBM6883248.1 BF2992 family fimbrillin-A clan protein [Bacteroides caecigallinarum]
MIRTLNFLYTFLFFTSIILVSCDDSLHEQGALEEIPEGCVRVNFTLSGSYGGPLSDLSRSNPLDNYSPVKIPDGTTLWIAVYKNNSNELQKVKSFVVKGNTLYPCKVDADGNVTDENDVPLYLESGTYTFRAIGPARELTDDKHLYIENGQYVIANDERDRFNTDLAETTKGTAGVTKKLDNGVNPVVEVQLNPLINQTAKLKFTIRAGINVYKLGVQTTGVEIDGLQNNYSIDKNSPWNWTLGTDTLIAYRGNKNTKLTLTEPVEITNEKVVYETSILPTDAYSTPLIILFSMRVNGVPSQFQMMLSRKFFLTGYSYHYMGTINLKDGIAAMEWMNVGWETNVPIM